MRICHSNDIPSIPLIERLSDAAICDFRFHPYTPIPLYPNTPRPGKVKPTSTLTRYRMMNGTSTAMTPVVITTRMKRL